MQHWHSASCTAATADCLIPVIHSYTHSRYRRSSYIPSPPSPPLHLVFLPLDIVVPVIFLGPIVSFLSCRSTYSYAPSICRPKYTNTSFSPIYFAVPVIPIPPLFRVSITLSAHLENCFSSSTFRSQLTYKYKITETQILQLKSR